MANMNYQVEINYIASQIKKLREERNLSIQDLAYKCDIERANLSRIEAGVGNYTIKTLCKICSALEVPLSAVVK